MSVEQAEEIVKSAKLLFIQNKSEIEEIQSSIRVSQQLCTDIINASKQKKPIKYMVDKICKMSQQCVKPTDLLNCLGLFRQSLELRVRVKNFLCDKLEENLILLFDIFKKGLKVSDVLSKHKNKRIPLRKRYPHLIFNEEDIERVYNEANDQTFYLDSNLKGQVNHKYTKIQKLKFQDFENIKREDATPEEIAHYIKKINHFENLDFCYQLDLA
jgi:hypothetical protein